VTTTSGTLSRAPRPSSLADVLDLILDKGLVIDAYVRVSLVGIELLTIDARIVVASVDTYLHFAEAVNRLDLPSTETKGITGLFGSEGSGNGSGDGQGALSAGGREGGSGTDGGRSRERRPASAGGDSDRTGSDHGRTGGGQARSSGGQQSGDGDDGSSGGRGQPSVAQRLVNRGRWQE
jgi:hypothetical protein